MRSHAAYIAVGAVAGFAGLTTLAVALHAPALPWMVVTSAAVPLVLSAAVGAGLLGRSTFARLHGGLARIPSKRLAKWLASRRSDAVATDRQVKRLRAAAGTTWAATLAFLACWCFEALESALLLRLVGAHVDLVSVFAFEAGLSMVRSVVVLAPSGLGVVDLGYATVLHALGVDAGGVAAFVLVRRSKECLWIAAGYGMLAALRGRNWAAAPDVRPPGPVAGEVLSRQAGAGASCPSRTSGERQGQRSTRGWGFAVRLVRGARPLV
jgi:uncharacterized membrane protein YbhN (UPF0104 family)